MGRYYAGRPIVCEFSPVTDFREATCRQYEENTCTRGGYCNFMHLRPISRCLSYLPQSVSLDFVCSFDLCVHAENNTALLSCLSTSRMLSWI